MTKPTPRIYLAGPDVFFPDVVDRSAKLKEACQQHGFIGVFPLDSDLQLTPPTKEQDGYLIYKSNINLIRSCQAVLANVTPFRGPSLDVGTAFEIGYAKALGLEIAGYTSNLTKYKDRVTPDGLLIENFGMVDNLMIHAALCGFIFDDLNQSLDYLTVVFESGDPTARVNVPRT